MFDQLVESKNNTSESARRGGFLLTTLILTTLFFGGALVYSLFAKELGMGGEDLELSTLVAPVPVPEEAPPPPEPEQPKPEKQQVEKTTEVMPTRQVNMARVDEPIAPKEISTSVNTAKARPNTAFKLGNQDSDPVGSPSGTVTRDTGGGGSVVVATPRPVQVEEEAPPPPTPRPTPKPEPTAKPVPKTVSGGVVNGKAVNLVKPPYPPAARAVRASGAVNVQVTIDENGNVISASAVSGHALLRSAATAAARQSKFSPTLLSGQKVKVTGVIVYNFTAQ